MSPAHFVLPPSTNNIVAARRLQSSLDIFRFADNRIPFLLPCATRAALPTVPATPSLIIAPTAQFQISSFAASPRPLLDPAKEAG